MQLYFSQLLATLSYVECKLTHCLLRHYFLGNEDDTEYVDLLQIHGYVIKIKKKIGQWKDETKIMDF